MRARVSALLTASLDASARVLRPLALIPVREKQYDARETPLLILAGADKLIDDYLRGSFLSLVEK